MPSSVRRCVRAAPSVPGKLEAVRTFPPRIVRLLRLSRGLLPVPGSVLQHRPRAEKARRLPGLNGDLAYALPLTLCGPIFQPGLAPCLPLARARIPLSVLRPLRGEPRSPRSSDRNFFYPLRSPEPVHHDIQRIDARLVLPTEVAYGERCLGPVQCWLVVAGCFMSILVGPVLVASTFSGLPREVAGRCRTARGCLGVTVSAP
jgi:hypothetical protein